MTNTNININVLPNKGLFLFFYLALIINVSLLINSKGLSFAEAQQVPAMYVFGDSLVDVGNNNHLKLSLAKANFYPNGVDFPGKTATGRFSNGKNAADFLAEKAGIPTSPPYLSVISNPSKSNGTSFLAGLSFASGGAGIFNGTDAFYRQSVPLLKQVEYFSQVHEKLVQQVGPTAAERHISKSLFTFVIGSNDLFGYFASSKRQSDIAPQDFVNQMVATLGQQIKRLHNYGARKLVVIGVGAIGCCPDQRRKISSGECFEEANHWTVEFNRGLKSSLQELKSELEGLSYSYFETYDVLLKLIQEPASYGFVEVRSACCGHGDLKAETPCLPLSSYCSNRTDHIFWDRYHPSEATTRILVDYFFDGTSDYSFPLNLKQLIAI